MKSRLVLQNDRYVFLHSGWFIYLGEYPDQYINKVLNFFDKQIFISNIINDIVFYKVI